MNIKKQLLFGIALVAVLSLFVFPSESKAASGINYVTVTKCEQVGGGVKITNFGKTYVLGSSCREAGHGFRQYKLSCVDASNKPVFVSTKYKVEWTDSCIPPDTVAPVITLKGQKVEAHITDFYGFYVDSGATAVDNKDGDVTSKIKVTNNYNNTEPGIYQFTYEVTDSAGNISKATRTVLNIGDGKAPEIYTSVIDPIEVYHKIGNYYFTPNGYFTRQGTPFSPTVLPSVIYYNDGITGTSSAKLYSFYENAVTSKAGVAFDVYHVAFGKVKAYDGTIKNMAVYAAINTVNVVGAQVPIIIPNGQYFISIKKGETYVDPGVVVESPTDPNYTLTTWIDTKPSYGNYYYIHDKAVNKYGSDETVRMVSFNN